MSSSTSAGVETESSSNRRAAVRDHALTALAETDANGETVKATVLHEFYRHHPAVSLEDTLELNVLVAVPDSGSLEERIADVLAEAVAQHDGWANTAPAVTTNENTSIPATESY